MPASTSALPQWLLVLQAPLPGESSGDHIDRILSALVGLSLKNHADQLTQLFLVNESPGRAGSIAAVKTNCGTSMREVWCLAGCDDVFVTQPYQNGMAVTWDLQAAKDKGMLWGAQDTVYRLKDAQGNYVADLFSTKEAATVALQKLGAGSTEECKAWQCVDKGWGLHYAIAGTNDDHMEFARGAPDAKTGVCLHAGGGREDNAITQSVGDIRFSLGRPLQHVINPLRMASAGPIPVAPRVVPSPIPEVVQQVPVTPPAPTPAQVPPAVHKTTWGGGALLLILSQLKQASKELSGMLTLVGVIFILVALGYIVFELAASWKAKRVVRKS